MSDALSAIVREGLKSLGTVISLELSKKLVSNSIRIAIHSSKIVMHFPPLFFYARV